MKWAPLFAIIKYNRLVLFFHGMVLPSNQLPTAKGPVSVT